MLSRRLLLRLAGAAVPAGIGAGAEAQTQPVARRSQTEAGYQMGGKSTARCGSCSFFRTPHSCIIVDGTISPNGWCRFFDLSG